MMKISHEVPISMLKESEKFNDYDYCLLHLLENEDYRGYYVAASTKGRKVLLDNSLFELGDAMSPEKLIEGSNIVEAYWYVVPDALNDANLTISRFDNWLNNHYDKEAYGLSIGVVQGDTWQDMVECYAYMSNKADKVAIPAIMATPFLRLFPGENISDLERSMLGRQMFIRELMAKGIWNYDKPHHLLGATLAREFKDPIYNKIIDTIDTSNPIVAGIKGLKYGADGLDEKPKVKLCDLIDYQPDAATKEIIDFNVKTFRNICS